MPAKKNKGLKPPMDPQIPPAPPEPGQIWQDLKGEKLEVVAVANKQSTFPLSVVGKDDHNNFWSYPMKTWLEFFEFQEKAAKTFEEYKKEAEEFAAKPRHEQIVGREIIPEFELRLIESKTNWRDNR